MTPSTVCFGARGNNYGLFKIPTPGSIITFKLTYLYGHVACDKHNPEYNARWGCKWPVISSHPMGTLITDSSKNRILPKSEHLIGGWGCVKYFYKLPWATPDSPDLIFDDFSAPLPVTTDQEFQVWFAEDLADCSEHDNGLAKTCAEVYGLYMYV